MALAAALRNWLTARRLAQAAIVLEIVAAARALAEIYRLHAERDPAFTLDAALPWVGGGLMALAFAAASILLYFAGRNRWAAALVIVMIPVLVAYKAIFIGLG